MIWSRWGGLVSSYVNSADLSYVGLIAAAGWFLPEY